MTIYTSSRFMADDKVMSILYLSLFKNLLISKGFPLLGYSGSPVSLSNHRQRISPKQFYTILDQSLRSPKTAGLGFEYGKLLDICAAGTVGQLMMSCNTLDQAFHQFLRFYPLLSLSAQLETSIEDDYLVTYIDSLYDKAIPAHIQCFLSEALLTCIVTQARWLSGKPLNFRKVQLAYARPEHYQLYQNMFGCEVEFACARHCIVFDQQLLNTPVLTANPSVFDIKLSHCREVLRQWESMFSIREQIYTLLKRAHPDIPSMELVARTLHLSRSSLYRKLRLAETNYQRIVDDFRCDEARRYLQRNELSLCDVAENLGFSDASNFRRAFKKWTGVSPRHYRESLKKHSPQPA